MILILVRVFLFLFVIILLLKLTFSFQVVESIFMLAIKTIFVFVKLIISLTVCLRRRRHSIARPMRAVFLRFDFVARRSALNLVSRTRGLRASLAMVLLTVTTISVIAVIALIVLTMMQLRLIRVAV